MKHLLGRKSLFLFAFLYTALLTWGSLATIQTVDSPFELSDKVLHTLAYFGLAVLWTLWFLKGRYKTFSLRQLKKVFFVFILTLSIYGILIEVFQAVLTEDRMADVWDVLANVFGILLGIVLIRTLVKNGILLKLNF